MDLASATKVLQVHFESHVEGVAWVYLFGSVARRTTHGRSDVDVAVLLDRDLSATPAGSSISLAGELEPVLGCEVDVVVLNRAPVDLFHRVLRDGRVVFDPRPAERIRFEVRARNAYFELKPILDQHRKAAPASAYG